MRTRRPAHRPSDDGDPSRDRRLQSLLKELYFGQTPAAVRFQGWMLLFDIVLIALFIVAPFLEKGFWFLVVDYCIAALLFLDLAARAWAYGDFKRWIMRPIVWADLAVLASLVAPLFAANLGFLRILRAYSMVHGKTFWRWLGGGRWRDTQVADAVIAGVNLFVFVFMMTALVHSLFAARVPEIGSFVDSLYFTVTSLTTTGYGDITLPGVAGRLLSIFIMIGGVSLFFRLIQVAMRAPKVRYPCPGCGLTRHEGDAVYCKACGTRLKILQDND
ncbi:potassium channel family protein [Parapedomonas caeni]|jgi:voltage-gated potassium channel